MTEPLYLAPSLNGVGDIAYAQNLPSIITGRVLSPSSGDVVLDMCAAPGGKTSHIASLMANTVGHRCHNYHRHDYHCI